MSKIATSGLRLAGELDRLEPVSRLADDVDAVLLQHLLQIEADDRLVFGDQNP